MLSLCRCQIIHINHASINIVTSILGGQQWHGTWGIKVIPTRYWRILQLMCCVMWKSGWLLTNRGHLMWINEWIIQLRRHMHHRWWQLISLWVNVYAIKGLVIKRRRSLPTLIVLFYFCGDYQYTLWTWHNECNMSAWWCCVPVILFVNGQKKVRDNVLARKLHWCLIFNTRNKIKYELFVSI